MKTKILLSLFLLIIISFEVKTYEADNLRLISNKKQIHLPSVSYNYDFNSKKSYLINKVTSIKEIRKKRESISHIKEIEKHKAHEGFITVINQIKEKIDTVNIDSVCVKKRGFIGSEIFGKDKCKEWEIQSNN